MLFLDHLQSLFSRNFQQFSKLQSKSNFIFPIINHFNQVVAFGGRLLQKADFAKYKNTGQTDNFNKSSIIYGIHTLRKARLNTNYAILVEGQMDVVALHQAGFVNAIATMGTAFNENHVNTLKRFVDKVIVCFDGDTAGIKATSRSLEPLLKEGLDIYVISLPEKLDPDEYIKKYGAVEAGVHGAEILSDYYNNDTGALYCDDETDAVKLQNMGQICYDIGTVYLSCQDYVKSHQFLDMSCKYSPADNPQRNYVLAILFAVEGKREEAKKIVDSLPDYLKANCQQIVSSI